MAGEASNFPLQYADDDFDEDMSMEYEKLLHLLSEDLDPLQVGLVLLIVGEQGFSFFFFFFGIEIRGLGFWGNFSYSCDFFSWIETRLN